MNVVRLIICDVNAPVQNVVQLVGTVLGFLVFRILTPARGDVRERLGPQMC